MATRKHPKFELVAVIDFSAAAKPGSSRPEEDRCWAAFRWGRWRSEPTYFPTRFSLIEAFAPMLDACRGPALVAWDFPFGYPAGSGLGGGRRAASRLFGLVEDGPNDANNRFEVADRLNQSIGDPPGPFWGGPPGMDYSCLKPTKRPFEQRRFEEWRIVERMARDAGHSTIQSVWKLYTPGSVGSQAIMGLATIERLNGALSSSKRTAYWPFDTGWNKDLGGIVHAECWPTLFPTAAVPFAFKDARQVMAVRDALDMADREGRLIDMLGPPSSLTAAELEAVTTEEGWILGFPAR